MTMHDGFGQPGGAAGIDNPKRVIKRQPERLKGPRLGIVPTDGFVEIDAAGENSAEIRHQPEIALQHQMLHRGQSSTELCQHRDAIDVAPAIGHAVARNQHFGLYLLEAIDYRIGSHVGRTDTPDRSDTDGGQEGDHGLGRVWQIRCNAVTRLHTLGLQMKGQRGDLTAQLRPTGFTSSRGAQALFVVAQNGWKSGCVSGLCMT